MVQNLVLLLSVEDVLELDNKHLKGDIEGLYIMRAMVRLLVCSADSGLDSLIESYKC